MSFDIVTLGSATVDLFADTDSELIRIETRTRKEELIAFPLGSKLLIRDLTILSGGGGTNTAVCFARLGLATGFLGKIGADTNGDFVIHNLADEHITFLGAREGQTGLSVVLDSIHDDRSILAFKGANDHLQRSDLPALDTRWVYMSSMMGESFASILEWLPGTSFKLAFNPSNYQAQMGYQGLKGLIDRVHLLVMNREEACKFLGFDYAEAPPMDTLFKGFAALPPEIFVITDGAAGVYVFDRKQIYRGYPAAGLKIRETTGAGDAFASTFTAMRVRGESIERAIHYAMTNAESVLMHTGAKEGLLRLDALERRAVDVQRRIEQYPLV